MHTIPIPARCASLALCLLAAGCAHLPLSPSAPQGERAFFPPETFYTGPASPLGTGFRTLEVFLVNTAAYEVVYEQVELNGRPLRIPPPLTAKLDKIRIDGAEIAMGHPGTVAQDPAVTWWQFRPEARVAPGQTVVLQVNFRHDADAGGELLLRDGDGGATPVRVPRYRTAGRRVTAVNYAADLSEVFLLCDAGGAQPGAIHVNGWSVRRPVVRAAGPAAPLLVSFRPPFRLETGMPLDIRLSFAEGPAARAWVRVAAGPSIEFAGSTRGASHPGRELGVDPSPQVLLIPVDGTCSDLRLGHSGACAWDVISDRRCAWQRRPDRLAGFGFCTGALPESWGAYGAIADAAFAKPYRLNWGMHTNRFLDEEEDVVARTRDAAAPRPFLYVPERFASRGRCVSATELRVACWMALASGARGIRYHFGFNARGLADTPGLETALVAINQTVSRNRGRIAPLLPVGAATQPDGNGSYVRVLTAWCGDSGSLYFVRDVSRGAFPEDEPAPRRRVTVTLDVPPWCRAGHVKDLETGETLATARPGSCPVLLPELRACRLLYVSSSGVSHE